MATTILLVDDDPLQAYMCKSLLEKRFGNVKRVADPGEALCLVEQPRFACDLVISRLRLPGIGGPAFVAELHNRMPDLPVLVLGDAGEWPTHSKGEHVRFMPSASAAKDIVSAAGQILASNGIVDGSRVA
jgi:DNA-binding NtrC family response regulator